MNLLVTTTLNATEDDGSCEYADMYYDCDGNCLSDADGDGVCDELEVPVVLMNQLVTTMNATDDNGSCTYPDMYYDCDGNCLADADGDGVCDEKNFLVVQICQLVTTMKTQLKRTVLVGTLICTTTVK